MHSLNAQRKHISLRPNTGRLSTFRLSNNVLVRHLSLLCKCLVLFTSQFIVAVCWCNTCHCCASVLCSFTSQTIVAVCWCNICDCCARSLLRPL